MSFLERRLRWPIRGDKLFVESTDWRDNACVGGPAWSQLHIIAVGYRQGADFLVEQAIGDRGTRDFLVYPIVFCYRHFLELSLKATIVTYGGRIGVQPNWKTHSLDLLWKAFSDILDGYGVDDHDGSTSAVAECVAEFAKIDPNSFTFRYPVKKSGAPVVLDIQRLDIALLRDVMDGIDGYFTGTDGYLNNLTANEPHDY